MRIRSSTRRFLCTFVQTLEPRQLMTVPTFGWNLNVPAAHPAAYMDATGTGLTSSSGFKAENLNSPTNSFNTSKGLDGSGRHTFGPATGMPFDGNYEFTIPGTSFSPSQSDVMAVDFFVNADFNYDRVVDFSDLVIHAQNSGGTGKSFSQGDTDGDGDVDQTDLSFLSSRYNRRLAPAPTYEGEVTVSSLAVQPDGTSPLVVNWATISDATIQASHSSNATKTVAGYTVYRSTDSTTFTQLADVARVTGSGEPGVYEYTDTTPADGTKYWYRIRPYYAVTQTDGTGGFQHLPTTNKAWRVSAMKAPSYVAASYANDQMFVSWNDNSLNETGYTITVIYENDLVSGEFTETVAANSSSAAIDLSIIDDLSGLDFEVVVAAQNVPLLINSAPASTYAGEIVTSNTFDAEASQRFDVSTQVAGVIYDAGLEHAAETITVTDPGGDSGITPGTYTLDSTGKVFLPMQVSAEYLSVKRVQVLFPDDRESTIDLGPEPLAFVPGGTIATTPLPPSLPPPPTKSGGRGTVNNTGRDGSRVASINPSTTVAPRPGTATPATPLPVVTVVQPIIPNAIGGADFDIIVQFPFPLARGGIYNVSVTVIDENGVATTIVFPVTT